jgi:hypothetical protein
MFEAAAKRETAPFQENGSTRVGPAGTKMARRRPGRNKYVPGGKAGVVLMVYFSVY